MLEHKIVYEINKLEYKIITLEKRKEAMYRSYIKNKDDTLIPKINGIEHKIITLDKQKTAKYKDYIKITAV